MKHPANHPFIYLFIYALIHACAACALHQLHGPDNSPICLFIYLSINSSSDPCVQTLACSLRTCFTAGYLFIYPNNPGMILPPPALALFASLLKSHGHKMEIFDLSFYSTSHGIDSDGSRMENLNVLPYNMGSKGLKKSNWKLDIFLNNSKFIEEESKDTFKFDFEMNKGGAVIFDELGVHRGAKPSKHSRLVLRYLYRRKI